MFRIRAYEPANEVGRLRCRPLAFFDSAVYHDVREKERYERPAVELVADDDGVIVRLLDVECDRELGEVLSDRPGLGGMIWHLAVHLDHQRGEIAAALEPP